MVSSIPGVHAQSSKGPTLGPPGERFPGKSDDCPEDYTARTNFPERSDERIRSGSEEPEPTLW
jgi:hypothetical protein